MSEVHRFWEMIGERDAEIERLREENKRLRAALGVIALEETDEYPSSVAFHALGNPPNHRLWEMVKAARAAGGDGD